MTRRPLHSRETRLRAALLTIAECDLSQPEIRAVARVALGIGDAIDARRAEGVWARLDAMEPLVRERAS